MARHAAAGRQDAFCGMHALDILRRGLQTHQNDAAALVMGLLRILRREVHLAGRGSGRSRQRRAPHLAGRQRVLIKGRMQQLIQALGLDTAHGVAGRDHMLVHQVAGNLDGGGGRTLAAAGL